MDAGDTAWQASRSVHRAAGLALTVAWVVSVLLKRFVLERSAAVLGSNTAEWTILGLSAVGLTAAAISYARGPGLGGPDVRAAIRTWCWLLGAGLLASLGYVLTGNALCFIVGFMALLAIHWLPPKRLRAAWQRAA